MEMKCKSPVIYMLCVLMLLLPISAFATNTNEYILDELGLTVSLPSDYVAFTHNIHADDPNLHAYGLTSEGLSALMRERNIYLNAWDREVNQEILVTRIDSPLIKDFNLFSDTVLSTMATSFISEYKNIGITVIKHEIYQHTQAKFIKLYISQRNADLTVYGLQYYTVYAGSAINITMQSFTGEISHSQEAVHKSIVDSAIFDTAPQVVEKDDTPVNAFDYIDPKTQTTFTIPANWVETPLTKQRETIDVKFTSLQDEAMTILYGSLDLWANMTADERRGYIRSNIDNSIFTKEDLAEFTGLSSNDVNLVTYGKNEYYQTVSTSDTQVQGMNFVVTMTQMLAIDNGYIYLFQFNGANSNNYYADFERLLSSVVFSRNNK